MGSAGAHISRKVQKCDINWFSYWQTFQIVLFCENEKDEKVGRSRCSKEPQCSDRILYKKTGSELQLDTGSISTSNQWKELTSYQENNNITIRINRNTWFFCESEKIRRNHEPPVAIDWGGFSPYVRNLIDDFL